MKKNDIDVNSILDEYKMSMGGCFFSRSDEDKYDSQEILIDDAIENHLFDVQKLLIIYDQLSEDKRREFFYKALLLLIKIKKK